MSLLLDAETLAELGYATENDLGLLLDADSWHAAKKALTKARRNAEYWASTEGRQKRLEAAARYRQTEKGKEAHRRASLASYHRRKAARRAETARLGTQSTKPGPEVGPGNNAAQEANP